MRYLSDMGTLTAIVDELRDLRGRRKINLRDAAEVVGLSFGYLGQLERGEFPPSIEHLERWADLFGMRLDFALVPKTTPTPSHLTAPQREALGAVMEALPRLSALEADHLRGLASLLGRQESP